MLKRLSNASLRLSPSIFTRRLYSTCKIGQPTPETHPHILSPGELTRGIHKSEFKKRRDALAKMMTPNSVAIFYAPPQQFMTTDIPYAYRPNSDFLYLSGFQESDALLVIDKPKMGNCTFSMFVQETSAQKELWDGPRTGPDAAGPIFECDKAYSINKAKEILTPILSRASMIYFNKKTLWPQMTKDLQLEGTYEDKVIKDTIISDMKIYKSPAERAVMQQAGKITAESFVEAMAFTKEGMTESMIETKIQYECQMRGAQRLAYPPVVACGENGLSLHYVHNTDVLRKGELVLVDAGCEFHGYTSDVTRTWPVSKKFSRAQKAVYQVVLEANKQCIELVKPGISVVSLTAKAKDIMKVGLEKIGVLDKNSPSDLMAKLFPHSVGHYIGMDVHDTDGKSTFMALEPGMSVTIEPGIYIPKHPSIPKEFHGIAVRIEDDVFVTDGAPIVLTAGTPKEVQEIEAIMKCG